jgi:transposase-like protein
VATRAQVEELLDQGHSYETAARELGISPGLAHLIATGRPGELEVPAHNPTSSATVTDWVRERARCELQRP